MYCNKKAAPGVATSKSGRSAARPTHINLLISGFKEKCKMKSERTVNRSDLYQDAFVELSCAADLLYTTEAEHLGSVSEPDDWNDAATYQSLSRKIHAVSSILGSAMDMLSVAENDEAGDYFNIKVKLMADIIRQSEDRQLVHKGIKNCVSDSH